MPLLRLSIALLLPACALADLPRLEPEPGVFAQVQRQGERYVLQQPDGSTLALSIPEGNDNDQPPGFNVADYDFDGHVDLAIRVPSGMVNALTHLYRYRPTARRFELLELPQTLQQRSNCAMAELEPDAAQQALYSSCRSGPRWFYDAYRFDAQGQPWLYKTLQVEHDYPRGYPYVFFPLFERTFDVHGKVVASRALDDDDHTQTWSVPNARLYLHERADEASRTRAYLIEGDTCEVLDQQGHWLLIRYASRKGPLERWVSLDQAYALHQYTDAQAHPDGLTLSMSDLSSPAEMLFTLALSGDLPASLEEAEVHLLFTGPDGQHYQHRLYAVHHRISAEEQQHLLDDNYIEQRDGRLVIYHPDEQDNEAYVPFFPELPPGRYRVRAVLTDPALAAPVYSSEEVEVDYPPAMQPAEGAG